MYRILLILLFFISCHSKENTYVDIKVFSLTPQNFIGKDLWIEGKIKNLYYGGVYFTLEDQSGKITVTTENLGYILHCKEEEKIKIKGSLLMTGNKSHFIAKEMIGCKENDKNIANFVQKIYRKL